MEPRRSDAGSLGRPWDRIAAAPLPYGRASSCHLHRAERRRRVSPESFEVDSDLRYSLCAAPRDVVVPERYEVLPDGQEAIVRGDVDRFADFGHQQGDNDLGF